LLGQGTEAAATTSTATAAFGERLLVLSRCAPDHRRDSEPARLEPHAVSAAGEAELSAAPAIRSQAAGASRCTIAAV